jgi:hypothetical protein
MNTNLFDESKKFVVTTSEWFIAPDGKHYKAVWGKVKVFKDDETLGIKTNHNSANWYAIIGEGDQAVIVAGCQIKYACVSMNKPKLERYTELRISDHTAGTYQAMREVAIYCTE